MTHIIIDIVGGIGLLGLGFLGAFVVNKYETKAASVIQKGVDTVTEGVETTVNDIKK